MIAIWQDRIAALEKTFALIAERRMQGVPLQNPALHVRAIGFEALDEPNAEVLLGILVTPWFMNLLRLPCRVLDERTAAFAVGNKTQHSIGNDSFEFIGAYEHGLGSFESCSLFSPMFEFSDQAHALATANAVLAMLRKPAPEAAHPTPESASRRGFLFGRQRVHV